MMVNGGVRMEELKRCPFCGDEAKLLHGIIGVNKFSYVMCLGCCVKTDRHVISTEYSCDEKAIAAWNRRKDDEKIN